MAPSAFAEAFPQYAEKLARAAEPGVQWFSPEAIKGGAPPLAADQSKLDLAWLNWQTSHWSSEKKGFLSEIPEKVVGKSFALPAWRRYIPHAMIGAGSVYLLYRFFGGRIPGKPSYYNTIEGLPELGLSGRLRKENTDFGSGWKGLGRAIDKVQRIYYKYGPVGPANYFASREVQLAGTAKGNTPLLNWFKQKSLGRVKDTFQPEYISPTTVPAALGAHGMAGRSYQIIGNRIKMSDRFMKLSELAPPSVLAHEFGHIATEPSTFLNFAGLLGPSIAGQAAIMLPHILAKYDENNQHTNFYAALSAGLPLVAMMPRLGAEISATTFGLKELRNFYQTQGLSATQVSQYVSAGRKTLGAALGTYVFSTLALSAGGLYQFYRSKKTIAQKKQKNSTEFSGKDDTYNTIEGLQHRGVSGRTRLVNTEFGSGWRGLLSRIGKFGRDVFQETIKNARQYWGTLALGGTFGLYQGYKRGRERGSLSVGATAGFIATDLADDLLIAAAPLIKSDKLGVISRILQHPIAKRTGTGLMGYALGNLLGGTIGGRVSGWDDAYNTIEGLPHQGIGSKIRRALTPFGSGVDPARAIAQGLGIKYEQFLKSKVFRSALAGAKELRELGQGSFGRAVLMETEVAGSPFLFVKKTSTLGEAELAMLRRNPPLLRDPLLRGRRMSPEEAATLGNLRWEGAVQSRLQDLAVPSTYQASRNELLMEYIPHRGLSEAFEGLTQVERESVEVQVADLIQEVANRGIQNLDIHGRNIGLQASGANIKAFWFDWGLATRLKRKDAPFAFREMKSRYEAYSDALRSFISVPSSIARDLEEARRIAAESGLPEELSGPPSVLELRVPRNRPVNPLNGMGHEGIAGGKRSLSSDHGSKWKGLFGGVSRKISKYMASGARTEAVKLLNPRSAAKMAEGKTLEEFIQTIGYKKYKTEVFQEGREYTPEVSELWKRVRGGGGIATHTRTGTIYIHPEEMKATFSRVMRHEGITNEAIEAAFKSEDFLKAQYYHEILEAQTVERFATFNPLPHGRHAGSQVIIGEAGFLENLKNKHLKDIMQRFRVLEGKEESMAFEAGLEAFGEKAPKSLQSIVSDFTPIGPSLPSREMSDAMATGGRLQEKMTLASRELQSAQRQIWNAANSGGQNHVRRKSSRGVVHSSRYSRTAK